MEDKCNQFAFTINNDQQRVQKWDDSGRKTRPNAAADLPWLAGIKGGTLFSLREQGADVTSPIPDGTPYL
jgi:hypothetical protein